MNLDPDRVPDAPVVVDVTRADGTEEMFLGEQHGNEVHFRPPIAIGSGDNFVFTSSFTLSSD